MAYVEDPEGNPVMVCAELSPEGMSSVRSSWLPSGSGAS